MPAPRLSAGLLLQLPRPQSLPQPPQQLAMPPRQALQSPRRLPQ